MTPTEFLLEFLKFHYKQNPFRKQETNEKDIQDFIAILPADIKVENLAPNSVVADLHCDDWIHNERVKMNDDIYCPICGKKLQSK